jgi:hypothetical protein
VRPDSAISAASEIARRKNKSFAQYTGGGAIIRPYNECPEQKNQVENTPNGRLQGMRQYS